MRSSVPRLEKPRASDRLAHSMMSAPLAPGTMFGRPMPMSNWDLLDRAWAGRSETIDAMPAARWVRLAPMGSADGIDALTETIGRHKDSWTDPAAAAIPDS